MSTADSGSYAADQLDAGLADLSKRLRHMSDHVAIKVYVTDRGVSCRYEAEINGVCDTYDYADSPIAALNEVLGFFATPSEGFVANGTIEDGAT